jgi:paired amphipathic helix protein Sin3a
MVENLKRYPAVVIPILLQRMKQKDIEWNKAKREWNKVWRQVSERNYLKSLDHQSAIFKSNEKKNLTSKG